MDKQIATPYKYINLLNLSNVIQQTNSQELNSPIFISIKTQLGTSKSVFLGALWLGPGGHGLSNFVKVIKKFNVLSENFWTIAVGKDKGFKVYHKIFELDPTYSISATTPLCIPHTCKFCLSLPQKV